MIEAILRRNNTLSEPFPEKIYWACLHSCDGQTTRPGLMVHVLNGHFNHLDYLGIYSISLNPSGN